MKEYTSSKEELLQEVYSLRQKIQEDESTISELRSNAKFLQSIFNSIQDGISVIDSSLNVIYANHVIKTRHPDMIPIEGKKCYYAYHKRDIPCESCPSKKAFETGTFQRDEFSTLTPEGKIVWRERNAHPVKEAEGDVKRVVEHVRDITEHKQLNNELLDKNKELEQVLYVTTHDLRSPLVNVLGFSKELLASLQEMQSILNRVDLSKDNKDQLVPLLNDDIPESIEYILNGISKMDALITGLLHLSRIGRSETRKTEIDMNEMIKSVVMAFDHQLKESQTRVTVDPLPSCYGDASQVNQVFSNLLDNAIKYAHPDRYLVIHIQGSRQESYCLYSIEDNGLGISPEYKDKIFDIFYRLNPVSSQGEGLGLTVIQKILYKHSGKICVESQPGQGSKFCVSLPASCQ